MKLPSWLATKIPYRNLILAIAAIVAINWIWVSIALADTLDVKVSLGNEQGELKFFPSKIELKTGEQYKLELHNPSPEKHYFTAKDFADASWTKKVEASKVEIKGAIHELELKPGATAEWFLTPMKPGSYELHCSIEGHAPAGMVGQIIVDN